GTIGADGKFTATVPLVRNATNHLHVTVAGSNGLSSSPALIEVVQDSVAPTIDHVVPIVSASGVPQESAVQIVFSEAIQATDIAGVQLQSGSNGIAMTRSLSSDAKTLTLTPTAPLAESSTVRVTVPSSVTDLAGNPLASGFTYTFRTVDLTTPATPIVDAAPVRTASLIVTISGIAEPFSTISVSGAAGALPAGADAQGRFVIPVTLHPAAANSLQVTATDADGNTSPAYTLTITHDSQAFTLLSSIPAAAATGIALDSVIALTFSRAIDPASLAGIALVGQAIVPATITVEEDVVSLVPTGPLAAGIRYEIVVPASVADLFGNRLDVTRRIAFTTQGSNELAAPVIYSAGPKGATNQLVATLSGYSSPGTRVLVSGGGAPFTFPASGAIDATGLFTFEVPLQLNAQNSIVLRASDSEGRLSNPVTALDVRQDATPPDVVATLPTAGAINVDQHAPLFVEFSEAIQPGPLAASIPAIRLFDAQNALVTGSWILSADSRSATFYATRSLAPEANFKLLVGTVVRDLAGNALVAPLEVAFTTAAAGAVDRPATPVLDPLVSTRTTESAITLRGSAMPGAQLRVFGGENGAAAAVGDDGRFTVVVPLVLNTANPLAIVAEVGGAVSNPAAITIVQVEHAAAVRILSPQAGVTYNNRSLTVAGIIDDPEAVSAVNVGGIAASIVGRYFFAQVVLDETAGAKSVTAVATLKDGSTLETTVAFSLLVEAAGVDTQPPIPRFLFPEEGDVLNGDVVETLLTVEEGVQLTSVEIDRVVAHQVVGNIFFIHARLPQQGLNAISVGATDAAGHIGTATVNVDVDSIGFATAPTVASLPSLTNNRVITLTGTAEPGSTIVVLNGLVPVRVTVPASGAYVVSVPLNPNAANHLQVVATDAAGNLSPVTTVDIVHDDTPPSIVATSPSSGQTGVPQNATIEVTFSEPLNPASTVSETAVVVRSAGGQAIQR
ncbi:MAG TPA: Ig-like domain-containing protein, partial [Opitutus sp.]|nr:Ig-like domain-containing protein [Opitutus sp.]